MENKSLKLIISMLLCLLFALTLCACGSSSNKAPDGDAGQAVNQSQTENQAGESVASEEIIPNEGEEESSQTEGQIGGTKASEKAEKKIDKTEKVTVENGGTKTSSAKPAIKAEAPAKTDKNLLTIEGSGMKEKIQFALSELKNMTSGYVEDDFFSLNNWGTKEYFSFKGVSLWYLLSEKAGISKSAQTVTITAEDGYEVSYAIEEVKRQDYINEENHDQKYSMIIAWEENGKAYDAAAGYPFRFVVGQKEAGDINKQNWVMNVKTITVE